MEEEEKIDYRLHLHKQIDNLVESGISVYDLDIVNKKAIRHNYILKSKIKEKIEELEKYIYKGENAPQDFLQYRIKAKIQALQELLEGK